MLLADYILGLVGAVAVAEPASFARLRGIVGDRSAIVAVDAEAVSLRFEGESLHATSIAREVPAPDADGIGATDRQTVLDLLAGRIEVAAAIMDSRLHLRGTTDGIVRMSRAIEILIDVAVRVPRLQQIARAYRDDPAGPIAPRGPAETGRPAALRAAEIAMLGRLGLLPGADSQGGTSETLPDGGKTA